MSMSKSTAMNERIDKALLHVLRRAALIGCRVPDQPIFGGSPCVGLITPSKQEFATGEMGWIGSICAAKILSRACRRWVIKKRPAGFHP